MDRKNSQPKFLSPCVSQRMLIRYAVSLAIKISNFPNSQQHYYLKAGVDGGGERKLVYPERKGFYLLNL